MSNLCKKCLIGVAAEDYLRMLQRSKEAIAPRDRPSDEEYQRRNRLCEACDRLQGPTCVACGCFVELRALRKSAHCPYKKW